MNSTSAYRADIDGLRALAIVLVLLYHFGIGPVTGGYIGVDVFFVISGFLITGNLMRSMGDDGSFSFARFLMGRVRRLLPALAVVVALSVAAATALLTPSQMSEFSKSAVAALLGYSNIFFWQSSGYFDAASTTKPLLHAWSLSVEWQFYLAWALIMWGAVRAKMVPVAILLVGMTSLWLNHIYISDPALLFFNTPFRAFEFMIGAALALAPRIENRYLANALPISGLALVVYASLAFDSQTVFPASNALVPTIGAAFIMWGRHGVLNAALAFGPIRYLGQISYSIYLLHWPLLVFSYLYLFRPLHLWEALSLMALSIILGAALHAAVERPFWKGKWSRSPHAFLGGFTTVAFVIGASLTASDGWRWRLPLSAQGYSMAFHQEQYGGAGYPSNSIIELGSPDGDLAFYIIGDSRALEYAGALDQHLDRQGLSALGLFDHGCFIGSGLTRFNSGVEDTACSAAYTKALEMMENQSAPVVLSYSWGYYMNILGEPGGGPVEFSSPGEYLDAIFNEIEAMAANANIESPVILIGPTPGPTRFEAFSFLDCALRPSFIVQLCDERLTVKPEESATAGTRGDVLERAAARGFLVVDPYEELCEESGCIAVSDGHPLYSDNTHLSKAGALFMLDALMQALGQRIH